MEYPWGIFNVDDIPQHSTYAGDTPSMRFRRMLETVTLTGDKEKAAQSIFEVSQAKKISLRLQLGPDA